MTGKNMKGRSIPLTIRKIKSKSHKIPVYIKYMATVRKTYNNN